MNTSTQSLSPSYYAFYEAGGPCTNYLDELSEEDILEIDPIEDKKNPIKVIPYIKTIMGTLLVKQKWPQYCILHDYMLRQPDINIKMRTILVDWLIDVHLKFRLLPETYFMAIRLIDKILSKVVIRREQLQLVGIAAMFLASKFEEVYPPEAMDFIYVSANGYKLAELIDMEALIVNTLKAYLNFPTSLLFYRRFTKVSCSDYRSHTLGKFILETVTLSYDLIKYLPSELAAAAIYMTRCMTSESQPWNKLLKSHTNMTEEEVRVVARDINAFIHKNKDGTYTEKKLDAVWRKYKSSKFGNVAEIALMPLNYFDAPIALACVTESLSKSSITTPITPPIPTIIISDAQPMDICSAPPSPAKSLPPSLSSSVDDFTSGNESPIGTTRLFIPGKRPPGTSTSPRTPPSKRQKQHETPPLEPLACNTPQLTSQDTLDAYQAPTIATSIAEYIRASDTACEPRLLSVPLVV